MHRWGGTERGGSVTVQILRRVSCEKEGGDRRGPVPHNLCMQVRYQKFSRWFVCKGTPRSPISATGEILFSVTGINQCKKKIPTPGFVTKQVATCKRSLCRCQFGAYIGKGRSGFSWFLF